MIFMETYIARWSLRPRRNSKPPVFGWGNRSKETFHNFPETSQLINVRAVKLLSLGFQPLDPTNLFYLSQPQFINKIKASSGTCCRRILISFHHG